MTQSTYEPDEGAGLRSTTPAAGPLQPTNLRRNYAKSKARLRLPRTRREAQVAALAGRGLSNAEIADQLVLSVRTVETHVYRAMQKRGVGDRRDL